MSASKKWENIVEAQNNYSFPNIKPKDSENN
jgi:hypothetical protein